MNMKQEDKELLLRDLCSRLPYGVKGYVNGGIYTLQGVNVLDSIVEYDIYCNTVADEFTPYLFPISSMRGRQKAELYNLRIPIEDGFQDTLCEIDFYHRNHFDYRGLIDKGLAVNATGLNIY